MKYRLMFFLLFSLFAQYTLAADPLWKTPSIDFFRQVPSSMRFVLPKSEKKVFLTVRAIPQTASSDIHASIDQDAMLIRALPKDSSDFRLVQFLEYGPDSALISDGQFTAYTTIQGPRGARARFYFEGTSADGKHFFREQDVSFSGLKQIIPFTQIIPKGLKDIHLRFDLFTKGEYRYFGTRILKESDEEETRTAPPRLLFYLPFDQNSVPAIALGDSTPIKDNNVKYGPGLLGKAAFFSKEEKSILEYSLKNNLLPEQGTISVWIKPNWIRSSNGDYLPDKKWRTMISMPFEEKTKHGSGAVWFWIYEGRLRADNNDFGRRYFVNPLQQSEDWIHAVFLWDKTQKVMYVNGERSSILSDDLNLAQPQKPLLYSRLPFDSFFVGNYLGRALDGWMDELKIFDAPLSDQEVQKLYREFQPLNFTADRNTFFNDDRNQVLSGKIYNTSPKRKTPSVSLKRADGRILAVSGPIPVPPNSEADWKMNFDQTVPGNLSLILKDHNREIASSQVRIFDSSLFPLKKKITPKESEKDSSRSLNLKLLETIIPARLVDGDRFTHSGSLHRYECDGKSCLETGSSKGERFAVRFPNLKAGKHYCFEIDFPDDKIRTVDMIAQSTNPKSVLPEYELQAGWFTGGEYPNTGKIRSQRYLYWSRNGDVSLIFMSARTMQGGAAVAQIKVYEVLDPLPECSVSSVPDSLGGGRKLGIYFEDPAILYDFGVDGTDPVQFPIMMSRLCDYMKYSGQDLLAYPTVWYNGPIGKKYNPRKHIPNFLDALLAVFDREDLDFMSTINQNNVAFYDFPKITWKGIQTGQYNDSIFTIHSTGTPHPGGWHNTPPIFNPLHPLVRKMILDEIDGILAVGRNHPSFRGIILHLPKHSLCSLGDLRAGYNDYLIDSFMKETGTVIPVDRKNPLRGKLYYEWLMKNAKEKWIDWRCRKMGELYREIAVKVRNAREDLQLGINCFTPQHSEPRLIEENVNDFWEEINRHSGIDPKYFAQEPNLFIQQTLFPASYRTRHGRFPADRLELLRDSEEKPGMYGSLKDHSNAWINLFDLYWEDPIGNPKRTPKEKGLPADWLCERSWRVSTLNPAGEYAMKPYILPLRFQDMIGITRGGFLIGTCGLEKELIPFAAAWRGLPARPFHTASESTDLIKIRYGQFDGKTWFYAVNTGSEPIKIRIPAVPSPVRDLGENRTLSLKENTLEFELAPWTLKSFSVESPFTPHPIISHL
ncbi:MAG: LamG-like jellyroll fold domain-containing protein [Planctomycetia bacterium]|nr:LamG-like jellyroll fold domain-containing protein [Planctomycetia bacterium]